MWPLQARPEPPWNGWCRVVAAWRGAAGGQVWPVGGAMVATAGAWTCALVGRRCDYRRRVTRRQRTPTRTRRTISGDAGRRSHEPRRQMRAASPGKGEVTGPAEPATLTAHGRRRLHVCWRRVPREGWWRAAAAEALAALAPDGVVAAAALARRRTRRRRRGRGNRACGRRASRTAGAAPVRLKPEPTPLHSPRRAEPGSGSF